MPDDPDVNGDRVDEMRGAQQQPVALPAALPSRIKMQYQRAQIDAQGTM